MLGLAPNPNLESTSYRARRGTLSSYYRWIDSNGDDHRMKWKRHGNEVRRKTARIEELIDELGAMGDAGFTFCYAVGDLVDLYGREDRLPGLLPVLERLPGTLFWDAWDVLWWCCYDTWPHRDALLAMLKRHQHCSRARKYDANPPLTIYRGCNAAHVAGLSWTTDRHIAERFAAGYHGFKVLDPVVASATIHRCDVLDYDNCHDEDEVLVDPAGLLDLTMTPFDIAAVGPDFQIRPACRLRPEPASCIDAKALTRETDEVNA